MHRSLLLLLLLPLPSQHRRCQATGVHNDVKGPGAAAISERAADRVTAVTSDSQAGDPCIKLDAATQPTCERTPK